MNFNFKIWKSFRSFLAKQLTQVSWAMKSIGKTRAILGKTTIIRNVIRTVVKTFWEKCDNDGRKKKD